MNTTDNFLEWDAERFKYEEEKRAHEALRKKELDAILKHQLEHYVGLGIVIKDMHHYLENPYDLVDGGSYYYYEYEGCLPPPLKLEYLIDDRILAQLDYLSNHIIAYKEFVDATKKQIEKTRFGSQLNGEASLDPTPPTLYPEPPSYNWLDQDEAI